MRRIRQPLEPIYLNRKENYKIEQFYQSLGLADVTSYSELRVGAQRSVTDDRDNPTFTHLRIGKVVCQNGSTHYMPSGEINGKIPSTVVVAGYPLDLPEFRLEAKGKEDTSIGFGLQELIGTS